MTTTSGRKLSHCQQQSSSALHLPGLPHLTFLEKQHNWNYMNIWKSYIRMAGWKGKCKEDHHSFKCNFRSCKKKAWKKIQVCVGFKPLTTAIVSPTEIFTSQLGMNQLKNQLQTGHLWVPRAFTFKMKLTPKPFLVKMSFICMTIKIPFHINSFVLSLVLNQRLGATPKRSIGLLA